MTNENHWLPYKDIHAAGPCMDNKLICWWFIFFVLKRLTLVNWFLKWLWWLCMQKQIVTEREYIELNIDHPVSANATFECLWYEIEHHLQYLQWNSVLGIGRNLSNMQVPCNCSCHSQISRVNDDKRTDEANILAEWVQLHPRQQIVINSINQQINLTTRAQGLSQNQNRNQAGIQQLLFASSI